MWLRNSQDFVEKEAGIAKLFNTQQSPLKIIDDALDGGVINLTSLENMIHFNRPLQRTAFGINTYQDLMNRIETLRLQKGIIESDLEDESTEQSRAVFMVLKSQLAKVQYDLDRFEKQLREFGVLPSPHGSYPPSIVDVEPLLLEAPDGDLPKVMKLEDQTKALRQEVPLAS